MGRPRKFKTEPDDYNSLDKIHEHIDDIDRGIIYQMALDPHKSTKSIANELSISFNTVRRRINVLLKYKLITHNIIPSDAVINKCLDFVLLISVKKGDEQRIAHSLVSGKNVHNVFICSGRFNLIVKVFFANISEYHQFFETKLPQISNYNNLEILGINSILRNNLGWLSLLINK